MNDLEKKEIWNLITSRGDFLKGKLKDDPRHPAREKFLCSYM